MVLNELNNLKIDGTGISVELKQRIYHDVFEGNVISGKITKKKLKDWLVREANVAKGAVITGIMMTLKAVCLRFVLSRIF